MTNCFPVSHDEKEGTVLLNIESHFAMYDMHRMVNPAEVIVGWCVLPHSSFLHGSLGQGACHAPPALQACNSAAPD